MAGNHSEFRRQVVEIGRLMYHKGWIAANDGNISVRIGADRILATPTRISKGMMSEDDLVVCDTAGRKIEGVREPTTELLMHLTIYEMRPDVEAVVHAHPPVATGFAAAGRALDQAILPELVIYLGSIPLAAYGLPGTPELSEALRPFVSAHDAVLLANHGAVAYGSDLYLAFFNMEVIEHFARITLVAELLGGPRVLPREEVGRLISARSRYGVQPASQPANLPLAAEDVTPARERITTTREEIGAIVEELLRARG